MNYYWFNRQEILQKAKEKYSKEKEAIKEKSIKSVIKTCHFSLFFLFLLI